MKNLFLIKLTLSALILSSLSVEAQTASDSSKITQKKYQAKAPKTQPIGAEAFSKSKKTPCLG